MRLGGAGGGAKRLGDGGEQRANDGGKIINKMGAR